MENTNSLRAAVSCGTPASASLAIGKRRLGSVLPGTGRTASLTASNALLSARVYAVTAPGSLAALGWCKHLSRPGGAVYSRVRPHGRQQPAIHRLGVGSRLLDAWSRDPHACAHCASRYRARRARAVAAAEVKGELPLSFRRAWHRFEPRCHARGNPRPRPLLATASRRVVGWLSRAS